MNKKQGFDSSAELAWLHPQFNCAAPCNFRKLDANLGRCNNDNI
jgi:hypothetical protein